MKRTVSGSLRTHQEDGQLMNPAQDRGGRDPSQEPCKVARTEEIQNPSLADLKARESPSAASPKNRSSTAGLPLAPKVVNEASTGPNPTAMSDPQQVGSHEECLVNMRLNSCPLEHNLAHLDGKEPEGVKDAHCLTYYFLPAESIKSCEY